MTDSDIRLAVTMGDPAGVGPETIVKAWCEPSLHRGRQLLAVGRPEVFQQAIEMLDAPLTVAAVEDPRQARSSVRTLPCLAVGDTSASDVAPATIDPRGGQAAYDALVASARLALQQEVDGLVTAPLHKTALAEAGHDFPGHTELLASLCGVDRVAMMLYLPPGPQVRSSIGLGVVHATLHTALRNVFAQLDQRTIVNCARLVQRAMARIGEREPRLAVAALNPHGGENGLFGDEEQRIIRPAVEEAQAAGLQIEGPLPADTLMIRAAAGEFDGVVAMYHDQGHIALKLLGMHSAVNVTLGLPIVRTSVAHGTAFDLAWQGLAEHEGMVSAVEVATQLARSQRNRNVADKLNMH